MARVLFCLGGLVVWASSVQADDDGVLKLASARIPSPALKYRLLPGISEQTTGDALPVYVEAMKSFGAAFKVQYQDNPDYPFLAWSNANLTDFPREMVREELKPFKEALTLFDKAARRERCLGNAADDTPASKRELFIPELYALRQLTPMLAAQVRLQLADGDLAGALHSLETGFAMARHLGGLAIVGYAEETFDLAEAMLAQLELFVQQPKAPNLYWALADLPHPLIDFRPALAAERVFMYRRFPGVAEARADANAKGMTDEQVEKAVALILRYQINPVPDVLESFDFPRRMELSKRLNATYAEDKKLLVAEGRSKEAVEMLPQIQVSIMAAFHRYEQAMDDQIKWLNEPLDQSAEPLEQLANYIETRSRTKYLFPIAPRSIFRLVRTRVRVERKIKALQIIEAMRDYAAEHGTLPASLEAIKAVPLPRDPVTGKPFEYKLEGFRARLDLPTQTQANQRRFDDVGYEATLRQ